MSLDQIREVRERSGAPMAQCKSALDETQGDVAKALELLQKRGVVRNVSDARVATDGLVHAYIHPGSKLAVLVEVNCETDFVARTPEFRAFCDDIAMQIAGMNAQFVSRQEVTQEVLARQEEIFTEQLRKDGKPEASFAKILPGKLNKWYQEVCLLDQESIHVQGKTVEQLRAEVSAKFGEKLTIRRFTRWEVGQGLQKRSVDGYVSEVMMAAASGDGPKS